MKIFKLVFSPIEVNTYILVDDSGDCAIIDCGCYDKEESERLEDFIKEKRINPVLLLNTHCHLDHVFGNRFVLEKYGLRTFSSEFDEMNRKDASQHALLFGITMKDPPEPAGFLADNQKVSFGTTEFTALHVPGHTSGSLAFYSEKNGCVFTGDALFAGSIGRTDLPGGDYDSLIKSIKNKLFVLPPSTVVYPGHGDETSIEREMKSNPFFLLI
ncbi:MAG: MBL fold metallo-hydrolase [Bacteroidales bacterium]|jgi:glyoxylase-like metal-dependent hydrolase (beta-lactamase superfamily II)